MRFSSPYPSPPKLTKTEALGLPVVSSTLLAGIPVVLVKPSGLPVSNRKKLA